MRILLADLAKARRNLIESKDLDDGSFLQRLWYYHLFWPCSFLASAVTIKAKSLGRLPREWYCRSADRLFGGARQEHYRARLAREAEQRIKRIRELEAQVQIRDERRFNRRVIDEALTNPNFVATDHTHHDRQ